MISELLPEPPPGDVLDIVVIASEKSVRPMLRAEGLLGRFDVYAKPAKMRITLSREPNPAEDLPHFKEMLERRGLEVSAIFVPGIPDGSFVDPFVRNLIFNDTYIPMSDALKELGYQAP